MNGETLTLSELAERSGVEARTLRSWMQQGVIPGPESAGRNARYTASTLTRVLAVKAMREVYGLSLGEIRRDLLAADEGRIAAYAAMVASGAQPDARSASVQEDGEPAEACVAARSCSASCGVVGGRLPSQPALVRGLQQRATGRAFGAETRQAASCALMVFCRTAPAPRPACGQKRGCRAGPAPFSPAGEEPQRPTGPGSGGSRLAKLAEALARIAGSRPTRRKARGEVRLHIPITPDLDLVVRGDHSAEEIARFEQVADLLRTILTGGSDHD